MLSNLHNFEQNSSIRESIYKCLGCQSKSEPFLVSTIGTKYPNRNILLVLQTHYLRVCKEETDPLGIMILDLKESVEIFSRWKRLWFI